VAVAWETLWKTCELGGGLSGEGLLKLLDTGTCIILTLEPIRGGPGLELGEKQGIRVGAEIDV